MLTQNTQKDIAIIKTIEPKFDGTTREDVVAFGNKIGRGLGSKIDLQDQSLVPADAIFANEWVAGLFNLYETRAINSIKGGFQYNSFLKASAITGNVGYVSVNTKSGTDYSKTTTIGDFNPTEPETYLQNIFTSIRRRYSDSISKMQVRRAFLSDGGLNTYLTDRLSKMNSSFEFELQTAFETLFTVMEVDSPNELILVPTAQQATAELRTRFIISKMIITMNKLGRLNQIFTDNSFTARTPGLEMVLVWSDEGNADYRVHGLGMFRQNVEGELSNSLIVKDHLTAPLLTSYALMMTTEKIHYSNSIVAQETDKIGANMKTNHFTHRWTELDTVDNQPSVSFIVQDVVLNEEMSKTDESKLIKEIQLDFKKKQHKNKRNADNVKKIHSDIIKALKKVYGKNVSNTQKDKEYLEGTD